MGAKKGNKKDPIAITFHKYALIPDLDHKNFLFSIYGNFTLHLRRGVSYRWCEIE